MSKYFSQCGQDRFINEKIFKNKRGGVFLDIGANDGVSFSNTNYFEKELGWTGICFEPLKSAFEKLQSSRSSININACAADEDKVDYFLSVEGYGEMLSGLKSKYDERHLQRINDTIKHYGGSVTETQVQCYNINRILQEKNFINIDFISIDTEGNELEILKAINFKDTHVKVIVLENNYNSPDFKDFLTAKGFIKLKQLSTDEVYVNQANFSFLKRLLISYL